MGRDLHVTTSRVVQECNSCSSTSAICNFCRVLAILEEVIEVCSLSEANTLDYLANAR